MAEKLSKQFDLPICNLDNLFWDSNSNHYGVRADAEKRNSQLAAIVCGDGWIIEGVYYEWLGPSFEAADKIIVLAPSIWVRHLRVIKRFFLRKLEAIPSKRESLRDLWRLLVWSHSYDANNLKSARELIASKGKAIVVCRSLPDVAEAIGNVQN